MNRTTERHGGREEGRGEREEGKVDPTPNTQHPILADSELRTNNSSLFPLPSSLALPNGDIPLPAFLPDATQGFVRAVEAEDLERVGVTALVMNVYHLMLKPGTSTIHALGGLHRMAGWSRPILTDSGGFQAYSLIRQNPKRGSIGDNGIRFRPEGTERDFLLTPEKSVQLQMAYGADIVVCLDDCTHVDDPPSEQEASVTRTIRWAKRCKEEFIKQLGQRSRAVKGRQKAKHRQGTDGKHRQGTSPCPTGTEPRPLLLGVVQGGGDESLRRRCAEALLEIGFDGFGYGGWPLDAKGLLLQEMLALVRELIPSEFPLHALGVGHPESVVACARMGYGTFDCALPTRDARTGRLYVWTSDPNRDDFGFTEKWFRTLYIDDDKHIKTNGPLSPGCDCPTCSRYSVGYLRHLHKCGDTLFFRLATLHNLRFMTCLMERLRGSV